jgi:hypothetical protein
VPYKIACVVEGHGDSEALPVVIRRIAASLNPACHVQSTAVIRTPKSKLLKSGELERAVELAARRLLGFGGIFVVLDCDDDCPMLRGPELLARATNARNDLPIAVVLAKREFESWYIAAAESLAGLAGFRPDMQSPFAPEDIRGAKEWLSEMMETGRTYSATVDQPRLANLFSIELAMRAPSFAKLHRDVGRVMSDLGQR